MACAFNDRRWAAKGTQSLRGEPTEGKYDSDFWCELNCDIIAKLSSIAYCVMACKNARSCCLRKISLYESSEIDLQVTWPSLRPRMENPGQEQLLQRRLKDPPAIAKHSPVT